MVISISSNSFVCKGVLQGLPFTSIFLCISLTKVRTDKQLKFMELQFNSLQHIKRLCGSSTNSDVGALQPSTPVLVGLMDLYAFILIIASIIFICAKLNNN